MFFRKDGVDEDKIGMSCCLKHQIKLSFFIKETEKGLDPKSYHTTTLSKSLSNLFFLRLLTDLSGKLIDQRERDLFFLFNKFAHTTARLYRKGNVNENKVKWHMGDKKQSNGKNVSKKEY